MGIADLICSRDGSLSMSKLAGATGHFLFAVAFLRQQVLGESLYNEAQWLLYGAFAIGHPFLDKTVASVKDIRSKRADVEMQKAGGTVDTQPAS